MTNPAKTELNRIATRLEINIMAIQNLIEEEGFDLDLLALYPIMSTLEGTQKALEKIGED